MKRFASHALALLLLLLPGLAAAIESTDIPPKFGLPWGASAGSSYIRSIPSASQIGTQNCAASLTDGFPPLTFVPASAGGCPPFGQDFNGILKQLSQWNQWQAAGGAIFYDSAFAAQIGGYPAAAILGSRVVGGRQWISLVENNTTDPDAGGANWQQAPGQVLTGTPMPSFSAVVPFGYVSANGLTIGDSSSNATDAAGIQTKFLFQFIWTNCPNVQCPIYTSGGSASTRGVSADADFSAHKALAVYNINGSSLVGADSQSGSTSNNLAGVPVLSGSATAPGSLVGENLHALTSGENGVHAHANSLTDPGHTHTVAVTDPGHAHANTLTDPGHGHTVAVTDPGHAHTVAVSDPGHAHANTLTDPGHVHSVAVSDPGHFHTNSGISRAQFNISTAGVGPFLYGASLSGGSAGTLIDTATTGITASANSHATGVTINNASAATGVTAAANANTTGVTAAANANTTGLSITNASSGTGITAAANSHTTGLTINNANSGSATGHNTVSRSLVVYWNLKL